jgi:DNA-binding MarR family transcriptional regulator
MNVQSASIQIDSTHNNAGLARGTDAWLAVVRSYNLCDSLLTARLAEHGVQIGTHEVLVNLLKTPNLTQQELASHCFAAKSGISMLISAMEKDGFVVRQADKADARIKRVNLTTYGEQLARKTLRIQLDIVNVMTESVSDIELKKIKTIFLSVCEKLKSIS